MAGLLNTPAQLPQASFGPEQQAQTKKAWQLGRNLIYNKNVFDSVMQTIKQDPIHGLAEAVVMVLRKIESAMGRMSYDVALATGIGLMQDVANAISETGHIKYTPPMIEQALSQAVQLYLHSYGNDNNAADLQQAAAAYGGE